MLAIVKRLNKLIDDCKSVNSSSRLVERMTSLKDAEPEVLQYLTDILKRIEIQIGGCSKENAIDLINSNRLEGWCWQSSQTVALMLKDTDYVERGDLYLPEENNRQYFHSWTCFEFNGKEYVLDPALNILCLRDKYFKRYNVQLKAIVPAKELKDRFIYKITHKKKREPSWIDQYISEETKEVLNNETIIKGIEDVFEPFFRSDVGYTAEIQGNNIESLTAHYYYCGL